MKKVVTIALFVFWAVVVALLVAGLLLYQDKSDAGAPASASAEPAPGAVKPGGTTVVLSAAEVAKHDKADDCWMIIFGKVYDLTGFLNSHPGGRATIERSCGKDGTTAYQNKGGEGSHSASARSLLAKYLLGTLGETKLPSQIETSKPPPQTLSELPAEQESEEEFEEPEFEDD